MHFESAFPVQGELVSSHHNLLEKIRGAFALALPTITKPAIDGYIQAGTEEMSLIKTFRVQYNRQIAKRLRQQNR
jgi:hypothetical protein